MTARADNSERGSYAVSIALHAALLAALLYAGASHVQPVQVSGPPAIEVLLSSLQQPAAPPAPPAPAAKAADIVPDKVPVMPEAAEAVLSPAPVAKREEIEPPQQVAPEAAESPVETAPSDAPRTTAAAEAAPPPATAGVDASAAAADFNTRVVAWIEKHKRYPENARRRGLEGTPHVRFRISRDGRVLSYELQQPSGQSLLDKAALDTIVRAGTFPPMPADIEGDSIEFTVPLEFSMRR